jgi:general secretion pathway protein C
VLTRVLPHRIEFLNSGKLEYAEVFQDLGDSIFGPPRTDEVLTDAVAAVNDKKGEKPLVKDEGGKFMVDQREVDNALTNLDKLYTDIRAVPNFSGGKVSGMKILSVKNDSIFAKLGLRRGDVLQKINGMELDVKQGFAIFSQLKDEKRIVLDLVRQSLPTTLEYEIR